MQVSLKIKRFNPEAGQPPHYDTFIIPDADEHDSILDLLECIRGNQDGTLALRRSCAHGVCGSDAMRINGQNQLACKTLIKDLSAGEITVEPLAGLPVIKDLIVDMTKFYESFRSVLPYFMCPDDPVPDGKERCQSPAERERYDDTTKCILCAACTSACPSFWANKEYIGPSAIVNAHRFIFDNRDCGAYERLKILNQKFGVWRCHTIFNCTEACPREIKITQAIEEVKRAITTGKLA